MTHSSLWGGVQTLVLTTQDLVNPDRRDGLEIGSADSAVIEIMISNVINMVPFQLLYCGVSNGEPTCASMSAVERITANTFTVCVSVRPSGFHYFYLNKGSNQKWFASILNKS